MLEYVILTPTKYNSTTNLKTLLLTLGKTQVFWQLIFFIDSWFKRQQKVIVTAHDGKAMFSVCLSVHRGYPGLVHGPFTSLVPGHVWRGGKRGYLSRYGLEGRGDTPWTGQGNTHRQDRGTPNRTKDMSGVLQPPPTPPTPSTPSSAQAMLRVVCLLQSRKRTFWISMEKLISNWRSWQTGLVSLCFLIFLRAYSKWHQQLLIVLLSHTQPSADVKLLVNCYEKRSVVEVYLTSRNNLPKYVLVFCSYVWYFAYIYSTSCKSYFHTEKFVYNQTESSRLEIVCKT